MELPGIEAAGGAAQPPGGEIDGTGRGGAGHEEELIARCVNRNRADLRPRKVVSLRQGNSSKVDV